MSIVRAIVTPKHVSFADELTAAIAGSKFLVVYQPIVRWHSEGRWRTVQTEALIRWRDARGRWIAPERAVAVAESHGLSLQLTIFVLEQSFLQLLRWDREGVKLNIAVNVSPTTVVDEAFMPSLVQIAERFGTDLSRLTLELSEAYPIPDIARTCRAVRALQALGVKCAIDDLGVRFSTLWRARILGVDEVKIDRSLIEQAAYNSEIGGLVDDWIEEAHGAGMDVTAEGVSDLPTLAFMNASLIDRMQGFLIARPIDGAELIAGIRTWEDSSDAVSAQRCFQRQLPGFSEGGRQH
jgi:EAL domain-containing protein (putative c-di-GMP-specific phosphodiesterase class I)